MFVEPKGAALPQTPPRLEGPCWLLQTRLRLSQYLFPSVQQLAPPRPLTLTITAPVTHSSAHTESIRKEANVYSHTHALPQAADTGENPVDSALSIRSTVNPWALWGELRPGAQRPCLQRGRANHSHSICMTSSRPAKRVILAVMWLLRRSPFTPC